MAGQFYDNPERTFIHLNNAVTTTAANLAEGIVGPAGKVGRVTRFEAAVTTVYVGSDTLVLDTVTPSLAAPPTLVVTGADNAIVRASAAQLKAFSDITADTPLDLATDGLSTSGVASITLQIDWH
jgi:hypothetical protein